MFSTIKLRKSKEKKVQKNPNFTKIIPRNNQYEVKLTPKTFYSQLIKRSDAFILKIYENEKFWENYFRYLSPILDETLKMLSKKIKPLKKVRKLDLQCSSWKLFTNEGLRNLRQGLKNLNSLQSLNLDFITYKIPTEGLDILEGRRLDILQPIFLDFEHSKITDPSLKRLNSLRSLHLNLQHSEITDYNLKNLAGGLQRFHALLSMNLNFSHCSKITDQGLGALSNGLKKFSSLKSLTINFQLCLRITDKGMKIFSESLKRLRSLRSLSLNFSLCINIGDEGLNSLRKGLQKLKSLRFICLKFTSCSKITERGKKSLEEGLRRFGSDQDSNVILIYK